MLVVVSGTGTEIGKTWVACQLARHLRERGLAVAARKPAQSFAPEEAGATDAELLASATGEMAAVVCPPSRWYPKALAPPMAAESMGSGPFSLADLAGEISWPIGTDVGLVELAGGIGSPQAGDGDGIDLVEMLQPDHVVLVAAAGLGTLSNISLATRALGDRALTVHLNRFDGRDEVHVANRRWLASHATVLVTVGTRELAEAVMPPREALSVHRARSEPPGVRWARPRPLLNASGAQVYGSIASPRRCRSGSVSPVYNCTYRTGSSYRACDRHVACRRTVFHDNPALVVTRQVGQRDIEAVCSQRSGLTKVERGTVYRHRRSFGVEIPVHFEVVGGG